ncbi:MAG: two-component system regulatory protein YycI [Bacillota bacterium]
MNWPKAKALLIAAFALIDIFLVYQMWARAQDRYAGQYLTTSGYQTREALEQLARANVSVTAEIPRKAEPMEWLVVGRPNLDKERLEARFFPDGTPTVRRVQVERGTRTYYLGLRSELSVLEDGSLEFRIYGVSPAAGPAAVDEARARELALSFLKTYGGLPTDAVPDPVVYNADEGLYRVSYHQVYQGRAHYGAHLTVLVTGDGRPLGIHETWPQPLGMEGSKRVLLPSTDALLRLAGSLPARQSQHVRVVEITLGYYSRSYDSDRWSEPPVWRIRLEDGTVYHVNAYTGHLEP